MATFYWRGAICAERLLDQLPEWLDIPELLSWLQQFVPDLLELLPSTLTALAGWAATITRRLQAARLADHGGPLARHVIRKCICVY